jgi:hypothetical protein
MADGCRGDDHTSQRAFRAEERISDNQGAVSSQLHGVLPDVDAAAVLR